MRAFQCVSIILFLVSTAGTTSTCTFEFTSLRTNQRFNMRTWFTSSAKVTVSIPGGSSSLEKQSILASGSFQSQLIQSHNFTSGLKNTFTGLLGNVESGNGHFGYFEDPQIIGHSSDNNGGLAFTTLLLHVTSQTCQRHGWPVDLGHEPH